MYLNAKYNFNPHVVRDIVRPYRCLYLSYYLFIYCSLKYQIHLAQHEIGCEKRTHCNYLHHGKCIIVRGSSIEHIFISQQTNMKGISSTESKAPFYRHVFHKLRPIIEGSYKRNLSTSLKSEPRNLIWHKALTINRWDASLAIVSARREPYEIFQMQIVLTPWM